MLHSLSIAWTRLHNLGECSGKWGMLMAGAARGAEGGIDGSVSVRYRRCLGLLQCCFTVGHSHHGKSCVRQTACLTIGVERKDLVVAAPLFAARSFFANDNRLRSHTIQGCKCDEHPVERPSRIAEVLMLGKRKAALIRTILAHQE